MAWAWDCRSAVRSSRRMVDACWPRPTYPGGPDRKSTRLNSSHSQISYAVFCLKKKNKHHGANRASVGYESKDEKPYTNFQLVYSSDTRDVGLTLITYKSKRDYRYFLLLDESTS